MKILHIIDSLNRGGAETLVVNTINNIKKNYPDYKQTLVTLYKGGALLAEVPSDVYYCNLNFNFFNTVRVVANLNKLIKQQQIDVVHSHLLHSIFISRLSIPNEVKLVSTYHSVFYEPNLVDYAHKELIIDKLTYRNKYYTLFVSEAVNENVAKAVGIKQNFRVLVNFASPNFTFQYKFKRENTLKIIMVGNLRPVKNHALAIKALSQLKKLPISLDIYGEGELRSYLNDLIISTNANVKLKGSTIMSSAILAKYDIFMMTSHHEGMPVSLIEAMQTGLPSLLNDLPMLHETAQDSAIYFNYDSEESLIKNLKAIMDKKELLIELSGNAVKQASKFSVDKYLSSLMQVYKS